MATKKGDRIREAVQRDAQARWWDDLDEKRKTVPVTIRLPRDVRDRLTDYCRTRSTGVSTKLREIVMEYLTENRII